MLGGAWHSRMPGPILSLHVLVSMTSVMIIVLIAIGYRGYAKGVTSHGYLIIYHVIS